MRSSEGAFDFQQWAALAKLDPAAFEAQRTKAVDDLIASAAPHQQARLRGLQWQIDMVRARASNPLAACMQVFNRMWESVYGERGLLEALQAIDGPSLPAPPPGEIVQLPSSGHARRHHKTSRPS